jgi:hypothetical protein
MAMPMALVATRPRLPESRTFLLKMAKDYALVLVRLMSFSRMRIVSTSRAWIYQS